MSTDRFVATCKSIATLGPIGYGIAPGTQATLWALPVLLVSKKLLLSPVHECIMLLVATGLVIVVIHRALRLLPFVKDPRQIVLDELIGFLWVFCGLPLTGKRLVLGFLLFRFFDIVKPLGIRWAERLPGAWGIVADDLIAGNYALLCLVLLT